MNEYSILEKGLLKNKAKKLNDRENEILSKAKQVEQEISNLRVEKIELVINLYREQLIDDTEIEKKLFKEKSEIQINKDLENLYKEKERKSITISKLMVIVLFNWLYSLSLKKKNVEDQIYAYQALLGDLKEKSEELELSYLAAREYLKNDKHRSIEEFNEKSAKNIEDKTIEFKNQIIQKHI